MPSHQKVLITVRGHDAPGITRDLSAALARFDADLLDIEQVVIHGLLVLSLLIGFKDSSQTEAAVASLQAVAGSTIVPTELKEWIDRGENIFLVDVREPAEFEIVSIPGATLIPKGEFLDGSALEKLPQDKRVVLYCKSGVRSAEALAVVKGAGFADAVHVGGGVVGWVNQVDPSLPSY